jgi:endonuclease YncB( thermonuclease family)|tara:strand:+ start:27 stop:506 length:480 start_codon:yes stop_codon:yes gene_type:complete
MFLNKRKTIFLISILSLASFITFTQVKPQVLKVIDGDTIYLNGEKIRFSGIDTPELKQMCNKNGLENQCGVKAKQILIDKIGNNDVECIRKGKDQYKRTLAECFINNDSLSSYLVRSGYAFAYRKYSKKFVGDEDYAKKNNIGMWSMKFEYPWDYRKNN